MPDIDFSLAIRYDGADADKHEIELHALGESLQGIPRIAATAGHFALTQQYSRYFVSHEVKVVAQEPRANCFTLAIFWNFVQQHQMLAGSFSAIVTALIPFILTKSANRVEEMRLLKDSLDKAIHQLGTRDESLIQGLLKVIEKMADDLRPAVRKAFVPIGETYKTLTLKSPEGEHTFGEADKAEVNAKAQSEITGLRDFPVLISELDLVKKTCQVNVEGMPVEKRIKAVISDPLLDAPNNPYSTAFAAEQRIVVKAKALTIEGEFNQLFISDIAPPIVPVLTV